MKLKLILRVTLLAALPVSTISTLAAAEVTGPSSSQSPYVVPIQKGVITKSILTVGDSVNFKADGVTPYRMVGIPDGLGAFDNGDDTFTLLMNHEIPGNGIVRDHGLRGAFVSKWIITKSGLAVLHGEDLMKNAFKWDAVTYSYVPESRAYSRFCSADLPALSAFYNAATGNGYNGRIYMNGEESGTEGRAVAHLMDGNSYELPWLGKISWENSVANPATGDTTVVAGTDDGQNGQVNFYVGQKTTSSHPIAAAGLANGVLHSIKVIGFPAEIAATGIPSGTAFTTVNLGDVSGLTGLQIDASSVAGGSTSFNRPEDGCWDPMNPNDFYFVTTAIFTGNSRLWRLRFESAADPAAGGTIDMLLDGTEGQKMFDNLTINAHGQIVLQEDVGGNIRLGKIWSYSIDTGLLTLVAEHDPARFTPGMPDFLTLDEESSGVIPMDDILGEGWYLLDVQAHYTTDSELVEGGQLIGMHIPPGQSK